MRRYGSKKASRPYERIHALHRCSQCRAYCEVRTKSGRAVEKRVARREIAEAA